MKGKIIILIFVLIISCQNNNQVFNPEKWRIGNQIERGNMVTNLIEKKEYYLIDKTQTEIIELLGKPKYKDEKYMLYLVDYGYLTPFHLDIYFNKNCYNVEITD